ncbi:hypothetical protein KJE07_23945 [Escherichia marmotae]|nr:hypothetical protein [Escherichia marmotae]
MQRAKNDSGAFFRFTLGKTSLFAVFASESRSARFRGAYNGSYGKWIGFSGRIDRICRWV